MTMQWVFVLALFGLVALPLVPSMRVWRLRIDSRPLRIRTQYDFEGPDRGNPAIAPIGMSLVAAPGTSLVGSVTAAGSLHVDAGSSFERLEGDPVHFGSSVGSSVGSAYGRRVPCSNPETSLRSAPAVLEAILASVVAGDFVIEPGRCVDGSLIVRGSLTVGDRARIRGAVKAHGNVLVGAQAVVEGSVFSTRSVFLSEDSTVSGPVVADEEVRLASGSSVGTPLVRSTVAGRFIEAQVGARVFGIVHAMEQGRVVE